MKQTSRQRKKISIRALFDWMMGGIYFAVGIFLGICWAIWNKVAVSSSGICNCFWNHRCFIRIVQMLSRVCFILSWRRV